MTGAVPILDFDQERAAGLGLDSADLVFLAWFTRFAQTGRMQTILANREDGTAVPCYWLRYGYVLSQLPILGVRSPDALARRLRRLVEKDVLFHMPVATGDGLRSHYGFGPAFASLVWSGEGHPTEVSDGSEATRPESREGSDPTVGWPPDPTVGQIPDPQGDTSPQDRSSAGAGPAGDQGCAGYSGNGKPKRNPKHSQEDVAVFRRVGALIRYGTADLDEAARRKERGQFRGPAWEGVKDSEALYRLMRFAKTQQPACWEDYLVALVNGAWDLHEGTVAGMTDFDKRRWADLPYVPSAMRGTQIDATLRRLVGKQERVRSFAEMAQDGVAEEPW